jgi:DNA-binding transcriptional LysR family regulator
MRDLNDLYYFVQVVDYGGFSPAARALGLQKSKLSRRILALEERLGVRLLNRSSRRFSITEIGRDFYDRCVAMLVEAEAAEQVIARVQAEPSGVIRVSCPIGLLSFQFGSLFAKFMQRYPAVELHLEATNRRVDVVAEGFDVAIRVRFPPLEPTDLVMRKLHVSTQCLVASPSLITTELQTPADLHRFPSIDSDRIGGHQWHLETEDGRTATVPHRPRMITDDIASQREAVLAGVGIAQLPTVAVSGDVEAGALVQVLPEWRPRAGLVHAVFPSRRGLLPSVRALLDFLAQQCAEQQRSSAASGAFTPGKD